MQMAKPSLQELCRRTGVSRCTTSRKLYQFLLEKEALQGYSRMSSLKLRGVLEGDGTCLKLFKRAGSNFHVALWGLVQRPTTHEVPKMLVHIVPVKKTAHNAVCPVKSRDDILETKALEQVLPTVKGDREMASVLFTDGAQVYNKLAKAYGAQHKFVVHSKSQWSKTVSAGSLGRLRVNTGLIDDRWKCIKAFVPVWLSGGSNDTSETNKSTQLFSFSTFENTCSNHPSHAGDSVCARRRSYCLPPTVSCSATWTTLLRTRLCRKFEIRWLGRHTWLRQYVLLSKSEVKTSTSFSIAYCLTWRGAALAAESCRFALEQANKQWHSAQEASLRQTALRQQEPAQSSPESRWQVFLRVSAEKQRRLSDSFEAPSDALSDDIESIESQEHAEEPGPGHGNSDPQPVASSPVFRNAVRAPRPCKYGRCPQHGATLKPVVHESGPQVGHVLLRCSLWWQRESLESSKRTCWYCDRFTGDISHLPRSVRDAAHRVRRTVRWQLNNGGKP